MRWLILLLAFSAQADLYIKRVMYDADTNGYSISFVENGVQHCLTLPEWTDLNYFPYAWQTVPATAISHSWPVGVTNNCTDMPRVPRTVGGSLFTFSGGGFAYKIADIPNGLPCGDKISDYQLYRAVEYQGQKGFAPCW
jgi:hypothetical protein